MGRINRQPSPDEYAAAAILAPAWRDSAGQRKVAERGMARKRAEWEREAREREAARVLAAQRLERARWLGVDPARVDELAREVAAHDVRLAELRRLMTAVPTPR